MYPKRSDSRGVRGAGQPSTAVRGAKACSTGTWSREQQDDLTVQHAGLGVPLNAIPGRVVITQRDHDYVLLNYRAATEYVLRYRLKRDFMNDSVRRRPLLVPVHIETSDSETELVEKYSELLETIGLSLRVVSAGVISVKAIPALLEEADVRTLLRLVLAELPLVGEDTDPGEKLLAVMVQGTDTGAERASGSGVQGLLDDLDGTDLDTAQRHHKGIWRTLTVEELSKLIDD